MGSDGPAARPRQEDDLRRSGELFSTDVVRAFGLPGLPPDSPCPVPEDLASRISDFCRNESKGLPVGGSDRRRGGWKVKSNAPPVAPSFTHLHDNMCVYIGGYVVSVGIFLMSWAVLTQINFHSGADERLDLHRWQFWTLMVIWPAAWFVATFEDELRSFDDSVVNILVWPGVFGITVLPLAFYWYDSIQAWEFGALNDGEKAGVFFLSFLGLPAFVLSWDWGLLLTCTGAVGVLIATCYALLILAELAVSFGSLLRSVVGLRLVHELPAYKEAADALASTIGSYLRGEDRKDTGGESAMRAVLQGSGRAPAGTSASLPGAAPRRLVSHYPPVADRVSELVLREPVSGEARGGWRAYILAKALKDTVADADASRLSSLLSLFKLSVCDVLLYSGTVGVGEAVEGGISAPFDSSFGGFRSVVSLGEETKGVCLVSRGRSSIITERDKLPPLLKPFREEATMVVLGQVRSTGTLRSKVGIGLGFLNTVSLMVVVAVLEGGLIRDVLAIAALGEIGASLIAFLRVDKWGWAAFFDRLHWLLSPEADCSEISGCVLLGLELLGGFGGPAYLLSQLNTDDLVYVAVTGTLGVVGGRFFSRHWSAIASGLLFSYLGELVFEVYASYILLRDCASSRSCVAVAVLSATAALETIELLSLVPRNFFWKPPGLQGSSTGRGKEYVAPGDVGSFFTRKPAGRFTDRGWTMEGPPVGNVTHHAHDLASSVEGAVTTHVDDPFEDQQGVLLCVVPGPRQQTCSVPANVWEGCDVSVFRCGILRDTLFPCLAVAGSADRSSSYAT